MLDKLHAIKDRFEEVSSLIVKPEVISNMPEYIKLNKEYKDLKPIVDTIDKYIKVIASIDEAKDIIANSDDAEMKEMAKMELDENLTKINQLEEEIKVLLITKDTED